MVAAAAGRGRSSSGCADGGANATAAMGEPTARRRDGTPSREGASGKREKAGREGGRSGKAETSRLRGVDCLYKDRRVGGGAGGGGVAVATLPVRASGRDAAAVGWMAGVVRGRTGAPRQPHRWRRWLRPRRSWFPHHIPRCVSPPGCPQKLRDPVFTESWCRRCAHLFVKPEFVLIASLARRGDARPPDAGGPGTPGRPATSHRPSPRAYPSTTLTRPLPARGGMGAPRPEETYECCHTSHTFCICCCCRGVGSSGRPMRCAAPNWGVRTGPARAPKKDHVSN